MLLPTCLRPATTVWIMQFRVLGGVAAEAAGQPVPLGRRRDRCLLGVLLIQVGQVIGAWWTIVLLIADSVLGTWLVRREGARAWRALRNALESGRMPATELADGALILIGGTLMLTPGFVTDIVGLLLVVPLSRRPVNALVRCYRLGQESFLRWCLEELHRQSDDAREGVRALRERRSPVFRGR